MGAFHRYNQIIAILSIITFLAISVQSKTVKEGRAEVDPVNVYFQLLTRRNINQYQTVRLNDDASLAASNFNSSLPVKIFAHGLNGDYWSGYGSGKNWLQVEDCNAFTVDWSVLAAGSYESVVANEGPTIAGITLGAFVDYLVSKGTPLSSFHLVGFSMGAHVVGNAGGSVKSGKLPRVTGLDPASYLFPLESPEITLDKSDGNFVDIIHTDIAYITPTGHADFYPNGGLATQPGCQIPDNDCCNHCRAVTLFEESIVSVDGFWGRECASYEEYLAGSCDRNRAVPMGDPVPRNIQGTFYLKTNDQSPYAQGLV